MLHIILFFLLGKSPKNIQILVVAVSLWQMRSIWWLATSVQSVCIQQGSSPLLEESSREFASLVRTLFTFLNITITMSLMMCPLILPFDLIWLVSKSVEVKKKCKQNYPLNRPQRPIMLWDIEDPHCPDNRLTDGGECTLFKATRSFW
jgi:hypothetical protein